MNEYEISRIIALADRLTARFRVAFPEAGQNSVWQIVSNLVRLHLEGHMITLTSLIAASGLPYGTAIRCIHALEARGMIGRQARSRSGKSFVYFPTPSLLKNFEAYAEDVKQELSRMVVEEPRLDATKYFFGGDHQRHALTERQLRGLRDIEGVETLQFLLHNDWYFMSLRHVWSDFRSRIGPSGNFTLVDRQTLYETIRHNAELPVSGADIIAIAPSWVGEMAAGAIIAPPGQHQLCADVASPLHAMLAPSGLEMAVPAYVAIDLLAVRRDLLDEEALSYPTNLDAVLATARQLHTPRHNRYGIVWSGSRGLALGHSFLFILSCMGAQWPQNGANSLELVSTFLTGSESVAAFEYLRMLIEVSAPGVLNGGAGETQAVFAAGSAAMSFLSSLDATRFELDINSKVKHRVAYLPPPIATRGRGKVPLNGFFLALPANLPPPRQKTAQAVLAALASPESTGVEEDVGRLPTSSLFSLIRDPEQARNSAIHALIASLTRQHKLVAPSPILPPHEIVVTQILGEHLHDALANNAKNGTVAFASAAKKIRSISLNA